MAAPEYATTKAWKAYDASDPAQPSAPPRGEGEPWHLVFTNALIAGQQLLLVWTWERDVVSRSAPPSRPRKIAP